MARLILMCSLIVGIPLLADPIQANAFCFEAPTHFTCSKQQGGASTIKCTALQRPMAQLNMSLGLPGSASDPNAGPLAGLIWVEGMEEKPHYKFLEKRRMVIDQLSAIVQTIRYDELGTPDLPVLVQVAHVVVKDQLFTAELHCMSSTCASHLKAIRQSLASLKWSCGDTKKALKNQLGLDQGLDLKMGFGSMDSLIQQVKEFGLGNDNRKKS